MGQCKSKNAEMGSAGVAQVQKRVPEYNVEAHKKSVVQTEQQVDQNVDIYSTKSESKDAREVQKKLCFFFSDSLQETTIDTLGTGIELSQ